MIAPPRWRRSFAPLLAALAAACGDPGGPDAGHDAGLDAGAPPFRARRSLVIALDGVRPDALAAADTPNLDALIGGTWRPEYRGAYAPLAQNLYDAVTVSGPNHAAIVTGATSAQHGVTGNDDVADGDFETHRHYLRLLEEDDPARRTAALFTWPVDRVITSRADFASGDDDAGNVDRVVGMLDGTFSDARWPLGADPDAIFLFLDDPDHAGHAHGFEPGVPEYAAELAQVDGQIGRILDALAARPNLTEERWLVVVTSDHGGFLTDHGSSRAVEHTIPFLVAGRDAVQGNLPISTRNVDVVPTVLAHHGVEIPAALTGAPRGDEVTPTGTLAPDLARYLRFDGDLADALGGRAATVSGGVPATPASGGRFGGHLALDDGASVALDGVPASGDFSVTAWVRLRSDGALIGDLDPTGWRIGVEGATLGATLLSATGSLDVAALEPQGDAWHFVALVHRDGELTAMYAGPDGGALRWMAIEAPSPAALPGASVTLGPIAADVDDLGIWSRALAHDEIERLFAGVELESLR